MSKYFPRITVSTQQSQKAGLTCLLFFAAFVFFSEKSDRPDSSTVGRPALNAKIHDVSFFRLGHRKNVCRQVQEPRSSITDDTPRDLFSRVTFLSPKLPKNHVQTQNSIVPGQCRLDHLMLSFDNPRLKNLKRRTKDNTFAEDKCPSNGGPGGILSSLPTFFTYCPEHNCTSMHLLDHLSHFHAFPIDTHDLEDGIPHLLPTPHHLTLLAARW